MSHALRIVATCAGLYALAAVVASIDNPGPQNGLDRFTGGIHKTNRRRAILG